MNAVVLCGGFGTRLKGVLPGLPKALAPIGGRPFLDWLLEALAAEGVDRAVLATGHLSEAIERHVAGGRIPFLDVEVSREDEPLGTAGAVRHALGLVSGERFLVLNGDTRCPLPVGRLERLHRRVGACATMLVVAAVPQPRQGVVEVRDDGSVVRFLPAGPSTGSSRHVNAGVYLLERSLVAALEPGRCSSLERDVLPGLAGRGLHALEAAGPLLDIGTPEGYEIAVRQLGSAATALSSPHGA